MPTVIHYLLLIVNVCAVLVLTAFTVRRIAYGIAALTDRPSPPPPVPDPLPRILILIPCRNEASVVGRALDAMERLEYPRDRLRCVVIDDASTDATGEIARARAEQMDFVEVYSRPIGGTGKPEALNDVLSKYDWGELVAVFDADSLPEPDFLIRLAGHFRDPETAAASGRLVAINPDDSAVSYYVYVEGLVHQLVTMRQASRLGMTPAVLGTGYLVRRSDLEAARGYRGGALLEDSDLSVALRTAGRKVTFDLGALCGIEVPTHLGTYWSQHLGWARGFNQVLSGGLGRVIRRPQMGFWGRIDAVLFSAGYLDRVFLILALLITVVNRFAPRYFFPWWLWAVILASPLLQVILCLARDRAPAGRYLKIPLIALLFPVDALISVQALVMDFLGRPSRWYKTPRRGEREKAGSSGDSQAQG